MRDWTATAWSPTDPSSIDGVLTVAEVAALLDRTPQAVRDLIAAGALPARRIGRAFVVPRGEVERLQRLPRPTGRPWSPAAAWELLAVLSTPTDAVPSAGAGGGDGTRRRIALSPARRRQLCERDVGELAARLEVRAWRAPVAIAAGRWRQLLDDARVVPSGGGLAVTTDAYVAAAELSAVVERYGLRAGEGTGAGVLRVVPTGVPVDLMPRRPRAGEAAAAMDAVDDPDTDRHSEGLARLARLQRRACAAVTVSR